VEGKGKKPDAEGVEQAGRGQAIMKCVNNGSYLDSLMVLRTICEGGHKILFGVDGCCAVYNRDTIYVLYIWIYIYI
jgi:hypothetical protein